MAKIQNYKGGIELISGLRQKNNGSFALLEAHAIQTREDGTRLDAELDALFTALEAKAAQKDIDAVSALIGPVAEGKTLVDLINEETQRATLVEDKHAAALAILIGQDLNKSVREIATEEVVKIVNGADEKYDTLKEISDFLLNDTIGVAAMLNDIALLKDKVDIGDKTVSEYIADVIKGGDYFIPVASATALGGVLSAIDEESIVDGVIVHLPRANAVYVEEDGQMSIKKVTTDILENGELELVLSGGDSLEAATVD